MTHLEQKMVNWIIIELAIKRLLMETSSFMYFLLHRNGKIVNELRVWN